MHNIRQIHTPVPHNYAYEPEIPQNTGNIMRTCMAANCVLHLIKPYGFVLDEKHLRRAGMDYRKEIEIHEYENWDDFSSKNDGKFFFFTRYGHKPHSSFDYSDVEENIYLVFGKESTGVPKEILRNYLDSCFRIPTNDYIRSLNLSNCVALVLYEVLRQQDYPNLLRTEPFKGEDYLSQ